MVHFVIVFSAAIANFVKVKDNVFPIKFCVGLWSTEVSLIIEVVPHTKVLVNGILERIMQVLD